MDDLRKKLVEELGERLRALEANIVELQLALKTRRQKLEERLRAADGDEAYALFAVIQFLMNDIGIDPLLLDPLRKRCDELADVMVRGPFGGRSRSALKMVWLAQAAALHTYCREIKRPLQFSGEVRSEVKKFRDQLSRGRARPIARKLYEQCLAELLARPRARELYELRLAELAELHGTKR
jgi:hypothetical protein